MSVSVIIVNWNGGDGVLACLASLRQQTRPADEIIVVDNASRDGSCQRIAESYPEVKLLRLDRNTGFGGGVNRGAEVATGDWLALLNNDAIADREWLAAMLEATQGSAAIGMVACKVYLDRAGRVLDKVGHRITLDGQNFGRGHRAIDVGQYDHLRTVAWPDGCAGLFRRQVFLQVGGVDEEFFAYADDADLGIRFRIAGWTCALAPRAVVEHRHSQSLGAYSPRKLFLVERNRIWLSAIYFPLPLLLANPFVWLARALLTVAAGRRGDGPWSQVASRGEVARAILSAQVAGWLGVPRQRRKRASLPTRCGAEWQRRLRALLREAHVGLRAFARGEIA